jgi:hypothetical protein
MFNSYVKLPEGILPYVASVAGYFIWIYFNMSNPRLAAGMRCLSEWNCRHDREGLSVVHTMDPNRRLSSSQPPGKVDESSLPTAHSRVYAGWGMVTISYKVSVKKCIGTLGCHATLCKCIFSRICAPNPACQSKKMMSSPCTYPTYPSLVSLSLGLLWCLLILFLFRQCALSSEKWMGSNSLDHFASPKWPREQKKNNETYYAGTLTSEFLTSLYSIKGKLY